jgi:hypothetical protein
MMGKPLATIAMTDQHRATPEQWEVVEICREEGKIPWPTATALLELRARIEALEAAQQDKLDRLIALDQEAAMDELRAASAEARPAGLVERVAQGIAAADDEGLTNMTWNYHARAAIREVATWLDTKGQHGCSLWLREEADRG